LDDIVDLGIGHAVADGNQLVHLGQVGAEVLQETSLQELRIGIREERGAGQQGAAKNPKFAVLVNERDLVGHRQGDQGQSGIEESFVGDSAGHR